MGKAIYGLRSQYYTHLSISFPPKEHVRGDGFGPCKFLSSFIGLHYGYLALSFPSVGRSEKQRTKHSNLYMHWNNKQSCRAPHISVCVIPHISVWIALLCCPHDRLLISLSIQVGINEEGLGNPIINPLIFFLPPLSFPPFPTVSAYLINLPFIDTTVSLAHSCLSSWLAHLVLGFTRVPIIPTSIPRLLTLSSLCLPYLPTCPAVAISLLDSLLIPPSSKG